MAGYWVSAVRSLNDMEKFAAYQALSPAPIAEHGGKVLVAGVPELISGEGRKEITVVIEFPTLEAAVAAYESPGYQAACEALGDGLTRDMRIVAGLG